MQSSNQFLMIQPVNFGFNEETAVNNTFQVYTTKDLQEKALTEFNNFVDLLKKNKVNLTVIPDTPEPFTPDSIFPNNWVSFHEDGSIFLYPMFAPSRRKEKKKHILDYLQQNFLINNIYDLGKYENEGLFLEGTGSMVLDRENKIAYACISPRTDAGLLKKFCRMAGYTSISFTADDLSGAAIYHTNVMMCVADKFATICLESIRNKTEQTVLLNSLASAGKEVIDISLYQLNNFAGNMLQIRNAENESLLIMSSRACSSLNTKQISRFEKYSNIIQAPLDTIESAGGGSARCMIAEIFNPVKPKDKDK